MALSPLRSREERFVEVKPAPLPSRTYMLDLESGQIKERLIDGQEAIRQSIQKAVLTARYRYLIYNSQYGCEIETLLGQDISPQLLHSEITRVITEAIKEDDRIQAVEQFRIERASDKLFVTFTVITAEGAIEQEVSI
ncbi:DUF2634 domain-containing protein [Paenibacillus sp. alder61]|uniref:DUF2634 domain-containing protein n=1 Tax=Paenibacillus faecis TaxID=862114 RepID=A0A5D0CKZ1_9BACL|nr:MULTISPECIES: DUF2634 domain-containing protein [Paenibacillus]MCA1294574.1 DUF2634 domain-containing protein [Paenibacillus sp. alder61]TYA10352.1 DUF2634 domain-containing protein [Paenibacillus faecis]